MRLTHSTVAQGSHLIPLTVAGITGVILSDPNRLLALEPEPFTLLLLLISILCNILLNTFATANIIIRLLLHRRKMIASFGRTSLLSNYHLGIVGILLESAIINVPLSIASVACALVVGGFGLMAWELGVPSQVCHFGCSPTCSDVFYSRFHLY